LLEISVAMQVQTGMSTFSLACSEPLPDQPNMGINHDRYEALGPINLEKSFHHEVHEEHEEKSVS
jgi:hypothetical protein